ncbi:MAG TPA: glutathione S-transferase N-terminal domain-containing protein [Caulobacteraceae bacterium]|jgi:glutathione S-transferase|nr:glutathione S-transferase N-terminal domain-containing protein [Caulobacteraceae bacterium]
MDTAESIALMGAPGSPYTRKMLAVLRYRRIAYRFLSRNQAAAAGMPAPKVGLLPTFYLPGAGGELEAVVDSSPIIRRLEAEHAGRGVIPADPGLAFLDELIEDYADEWLTKAMFHYRWAYADDVDKASKLLPLWQHYSIADQALAERAAMIGERQISRLHVVGSNATTGPVIEASYRRFLAAFEAHLTRQPFILGERPGSSDFAVFGQLTQLAQFDPTPAALTLAMAPRVLAWTSLMEDQSGLEPADDGWQSIEALPDTLMALLTEIGRVYPPVMLANARAVVSGAAEVVAEVDGHPWRQPPFAYQAKCVQWLRQSHARLPAPSRDAVGRVLEATGCAPVVAGDLAAA